MADYFFYKGQMYRTDELKHWKYVKRERRNGKWVYYYNNSELKNAKEQRDQSRRDLIGAGLKLKETDRKLSDGASLKEIREFANRDRVYNYRANLNSKAEKNYRKIAVKHLAAKPIAKGVAYIANLFSGMGAKLKKANNKTRKVKTHIIDVPKYE